MCPSPVPSLPIHRPAFGFLFCSIIFKIYIFFRSVVLILYLDKFLIGNSVEDSKKIPPCKPHLCNCANLRINGSTVQVFMCFSNNSTDLIIDPPPNRSEPLVRLFGVSARLFCPATRLSPNAVLFDILRTSRNQSPALLHTIPNQFPVPGIHLIASPPLFSGGATDCSND